MSRGDHKVSKITSEAIFAVRPITSTSFLISLVLCLSILLVDIKYKVSDEIRGYAHDVLLPLYKTLQVPGKFINKASDTWQTNQELRKKIFPGGGGVGGGCGWVGGGWGGDGWPD